MYFPSKGIDQIDEKGLFLEGKGLQGIHEGAPFLPVEDTPSQEDENRMKCTQKACHAAEVTRKMSQFLSQNNVVNTTR